MRVYVNKGEYLRTEEKCMLVAVVLSIIIIVFSQHDYSVALPFQCLPPDFLLPRSTLLAES